MQGEGGLTKTGVGVLQLGGTNTYAGITQVDQGEIALTGSIIGDVLVGEEGQLFGNGSIGGNVTVAADGIFDPGNQTVGPGDHTLEITGNLTLDNQSVLFWELNYQDNAENLNDRVVVGGNLTLDGFLSIPGDAYTSLLSQQTSWTLFEYSGNLIDHGLVIGAPTLPSGFEWRIDTSTAGEVNLIAAAVPEPSAAILGMIAILPLLRRRR